MKNDFEIMGLMIYFGFIQLVDGGFSDLKAFEKNTDLKNMFDDFNTLDIYKDNQIPKLATRSFLALRGCYRKKKLSTEEAYKKLKLVADKIGADHLQFCINSTITLYYPDKKIPQNAFEEITQINEKLGLNINFDYKHLAIEDLTTINRIKAKAKVDIIKKESSMEDRSVKSILIVGIGMVILAAIVFLLLL